MTLSQRLSIKASEQRSRLAELAGLDELTPELRAELDTLGTTHQDTEAQLRAAIAADAAATPPDNPAIDSEVRERLELRAKTGIGDFLRAAVGGAAVSGAAAEYADACGVPTVGHLPMAIFARPAPTVETRAITPGPAVKGVLQPTVPFVFERSAAASLGIMMPTVPMGQVQIPKITTAPPADTLAKDGAAPATAAAVTLVNQAPVRIAGGSVRGRVEDLAVMPTLEAALRQSRARPWCLNALGRLPDRQRRRLGAEPGRSDSPANRPVQPDRPAVLTFATFLASFADFRSMVCGRPRSTHVMILRERRSRSKTFAPLRGVSAETRRTVSPAFDYSRTNAAMAIRADFRPGAGRSAQATAGNRGLSASSIGNAE